MNLRRPIYKKTAAYGHFGRNDKDFTWEATDKAAALRQQAGLQDANTPVQPRRLRTREGGSPSLTSHRESDPAKFRQRNYGNNTHQRGVRHREY